MNAVFGCLMSKGLGEMDYDERARLRSGLEYPGVVPVPELVAVPVPQAEEDEERPDKLETEAAYAARMMRRLVESGARVSDGGQLRPVGYGDMAVLLRSVNVSGPVWRRVLSREGVPVEAGQSGGFFEAAEVSVMLSLLAVIDNPRQDVALISVLRSALFGFTPDELTQIRLASARATSTPRSAPAPGATKRPGPSSIRSQASVTSRGIRSWPGCSGRSTTGWTAWPCARALRDGEGRRARLMRLFELARSFEASGWRGLRRFLEWLRSMRERGEEPPSRTRAAAQPCA